MDPILLLVASIFAILLASITVNLYYICRHYLYHSDNTTVATQMIQNLPVNTEIQTENHLNIQDKEVQNIQQMKTTGTDPHNLEQVDTCIQMDKVYYVMLPKQLDCISEQLTTNRTDLTHCMEWVGACEQTTLNAACVVDQQTQLIQNIRESIQSDVHQELQKYQTDILQDVHFQLNLLAETFEQNRIVHLGQQEVQQPPWEWLPYQCRTRSHQQYWNRRTRQDQFWRNIREHEQQGPPQLPQPVLNDPPMPDLEE